MDTGNWRPTQNASGGTGDPTKESGDWRAQLQADLRQRIVNKIMDTLKRHLPVSGHEGLQELKKIAVRFEEKIYAAATSQSDYLRKISLKLLTMETRSQNPKSDPMQSNSTANSVNPSDQGSQVMQQVSNQGQQLSMPVPSNNMQQGQQMMSRSMHNTVGSTGMQGSSGLSSALPPGSGLQQPNMANVAGQSSNLQSMPKASSTLFDSTAQTGNPNGENWQEEVYQKIKAMKDLYLLDLNDIHQKILSKLQQHDSLPQQPKNEQLEKLKVFKNMLERFMQFLQIPKQGILANYKDKLGTYEKQIINVINSNRRKPTATQQEAQGQTLPPPHMQSLQQPPPHSQLSQVPSHENQMNLHGSMTPMQQNHMGNLQQNHAVSLSGGSNAQQNMMNSMQPSSNLDPGQNTSMNSLQHVSSGGLQQNTVNGTPQVNINPISLQANSNMLQHQHIKQQLMQQQQQQHQFHQQTKQQLPGNQLSQLPQISDGGDIKLRQTARMSVPIPVPALSSHYYVREPGESSTVSGIPAPHQYSIPSSLPQDLGWIWTLYEHSVEHNIAIAEGAQCSRRMTDDIIILQQVALSLRQLNAYRHRQLGRMLSLIQLCLGLIVILILLCMWLIYRLWD